MADQAQMAKFLDKIDNAIERSGLNTVEVIGLLTTVTHNILTQSYDKAVEIEKQMGVDQ